MKRFIITLFLWLCWGFAIGTFLLLGPLRSLINFQREKSAADSSESITVILAIVILAIVTFAIAFLSAKALTGKALNTPKKITLWLVPIFAAIAAVYIFLNPNLVNADKVDKVDVVNTTFSVGPYPELEKMMELKRMGHTAIISLLHQAVVPFEPLLIEKERKNAEIAGLQFIHIPFLPWISDNENSIDSLRKLVKKASGKYYIHCYLGVDRITAATRIINQEGEALMGVGTKNGAKLLRDKFERGVVTILEKDVYLGPQLTKEEYFDVIGEFEQVVSLSDVKNPEVKSRTIQEEKWIRPFKIPFKVIDVNANTSKARITEIVNEIKTLPKPIYIHGFFSDDTKIILFKTIYLESLK